LSVLVGCDLLGTADKSNPDRDKGLGDFFGSDLREECLGPKGKSIDGSETIPEVRRNRQRPDQVNMHMQKTCRQVVKISKRGLCVPLYPETLAGCKRACPCAASFLHYRPQKPLGHHLDGGFGPGVAKAVENVKDLASERSGYEWPRLWSEMCHSKGGCPSQELAHILTAAPDHFSGCLAIPRPVSGNSREHGN
jgi:hypothetical protein